MADENDIITLVDEETGEEISLEHVDAFEHQGSVYNVFLTVEENEDDAELVFMKEVLDENGETMMESLEEAEEDEIFNAYLDLVEESLEEEDDESEE